jgi:hypothetical protein
MQLYQGIPRKLQIDPQADAKRSLPLYALPLDVQDDFGAIKPTQTPPDLAKLYGTCLPRRKCPGELT